MAGKTRKTKSSNNPDGRPKRSTRDDVAVKIDRAVKSKAKAIADHRGVSVADVLSRAAEPEIDRQYLEMIEELRVSSGKAKPKGGDPSDS